MNHLELNLAALALSLAPVCNVLAQSPVVVSFSRNGELVCNNLMPDSVASVEWASTPDGPWQTNWAGLEMIAVGSNGTINVSVPMFYRVRGSVQPTNPVLPAVTMSGASGLTGTTATLNGTGNPGGASAAGWFRYSTLNPGTPNDSFGTRVPISGGVALGSGSAAVGFSEGISGLTPLTTYYYCAIVTNSVGQAFGSIQSFTTGN